MTKISDLTALTGAGVDQATDLLPIVDMSAAGAARNKKITAAELKEAIAPGTAAALDIDIDDTLAANSDSLIPTQQAVKAYVDANVGGANDLDDLSDVDLTGLADGDTLVFDSGSGDFVPVPLPGGGAGGTVPDGGSDGQVLTKQSGADQDVAWQNTQYPAFSGALVKKSVDQTAANYSAGATLTWDAEEYDTDSYHDTGSNTDRLTVATAGYYIVTGSVSVGSLAAGDYARIFVTRRDSGGVAQSAIGIPNGDLMEIAASPPNVTISFVSAPISCAAGDYFTFTLDTETDTSITVVAVNSWFAIQRIA